MSKIAELIAKANAEADPAKAQPMADYMKNVSQFLGLPSPQRKLVQKPFIDQWKKLKTIDWDIVEQLYEQPYREYRYIALDYLSICKSKLMVEEIDFLEQLVLDKPWWDTTDSIDQLVGYMIQKYPSIINTHIRPWMQHKSLWMRRITIDCQLSMKLKTNTELLEEAILKNLGSKEFFINKAIGWSLRDYSRHNPAWVSDFLNKFQSELSNLSVREAKRYLKN